MINFSNLYKIQLKMSKEVKLIILIVSLIFTLPVSGFFMSKNFLLGAIIYSTQIFTSVELLKTWWIYQRNKETKI